MVDSIFVQSKINNSITVMISFIPVLINFLLLEFKHIGHKIELP